MAHGPTLMLRSIRAACSLDARGERVSRKG